MGRIIRNKAKINNSAYQILISEFLPGSEYFSYQSYQGYHMWPFHWLYWNSQTWLLCDIMLMSVMSSCNVASQHIQKLPIVYFRIKMQN